MEEILAFGKRKLILIKGDLTNLEVEAIVFYAEPNLELGSGFGTAISVRGGPSIKKELKKLDPLETCQVATTTAGNLKAELIIHAVGPRFQEPDMEKKLRKTVENVLTEASGKRVKTIAFPPMGAGFYGVPLEMSGQVLVGTIRSFLEKDTSLEEVIICVLDTREFLPFQKQMQVPVEEAVL